MATESIAAERLDELRGRLVRPRRQQFLQCGHALIVRYWSNHARRFLN
jgi:hypothetical protein